MSEFRLFNRIVRNRIIVKGEFGKNGLRSPAQRRRGLFYTRNHIVRKIKTHPAKLQSVLGSGGSLYNRRSYGDCCKKRKSTVFTVLFLVRQEGLEPPTFWFVAKHSIQLSYWRILITNQLIYIIIFRPSCQEDCQNFSLLTEEFFRSPRKAGPGGNAGEGFLKNSEEFKKVVRTTCPFH